MRLNDLTLTRHTVLRCTAKMPSNGIPDPQIELGLKWLLDTAGGDWATLEPRRIRETDEHNLVEAKRRAVQQAAFAASQAAKANGGLKIADVVATAAGEGGNQTLVPPTAAAAAVVTVPSCTKCPGVPAVRRCAASKWEAVCETCATRLEAEAAIVAAAEEAAERLEIAALEAQEAAEAEAAAAVVAAGGSPTKSRGIVSATPSKVGLGIPITPAGVKSEGHDLESPVGTVLAESRLLESGNNGGGGGGGGGGGFSFSAAIESVANETAGEGGAGRGSAVDAGFSVEAEETAEEVEVREHVVVVSEKTDAAITTTTNTTASVETTAVITIVSNNNTPQSIVGTVELASEPTSVKPAPSVSLVTPCAQCKVAEAVRKAATSPGVWAPVCEPCGELLDKGKPPVGSILDAVASGLRSALVTEDDATEGITGGK